MLIVLVAELNPLGSSPTGLGELRNTLNYKRSGVPAGRQGLLSKEQNDE